VDTRTNPAVYEGRVRGRGSRPKTGGAIARSAAGWGTRDEDPPKGLGPEGDGNESLFEVALADRPEASRTS
jgi:hypothetical protein